MLDPKLHDTILLHVLYAALTRWIPVPFADFIAANIVRRQMVAKLAAAHVVALDKPRLKLLADEPMSCVSGCLMNTVLFPVKLILGKLFLLFRFKRFVDDTSRHYHVARLIEFVLREKLLTGASVAEAARVRATINTLCESTNTGPVNAAFRQVLKKQSGVLGDIARLFSRTLGALRGKRDEEKVEAAVQDVESQTKAQAQGLLAPFRAALDSIPPEHFAGLEAELREKLKSETPRS